MISIKTTLLGSVILLLGSINTANADFTVKIKNTSKFYVIDSVLTFRPKGKNSHKSCYWESWVDFPAGTTRNFTCDSNVDNWKRKFVLRPGICILNVPKACTGSTNKQYQWTPNKAIYKYPANGSWYDRYVIRDKGYYYFKIKENVCDENAPKTITLKKKKVSLNQALQCINENQ
jgi:hypothetical protein